MGIPRWSTKTTYIIDAYENAQGSYVQERWLNMEERDT